MRRDLSAPILIFFFVAMCSSSLYASLIYASSFGWNGIDDTQALHDAFTEDVDTIYIDKQTGDWVSGPLIFDGSVNNKVVIFERGVKIKALAGAFDSYLYNGLFTFINCSNVSLQGYGATLQMNKQEYIDLNDDSEWRHVITLNGCDDFDIFGLELIDSGGDGIEISGIWQQSVPSTNIHIKDCFINNNYRQGISITSARNVLIEHCEISNTSGTPPAYGIDLEPDNAYDAMENITIKKCRITGNQGGGILLSFWQLNGTSDEVDVSVLDCYIGSNQNAGIVVDVNSNGPVEGNVNFERCIIENQPSNGIFSNKRESLALTFSNIVIRNVGTNGGDYDMPVFIQKQFDYSGFPLGNVTFESVFIDDHLFSRDFLDISHWGGSTQVENINGEFYVYNPNGVSYSIEPPLVNVKLSAVSLPSLPAGNVSISSNDNTAYETGNNTTASFSVARAANNTSFPLSVFFDVSGTAENRLDYNYFPRALVIPANSAEATYVVQAIEDELTEPVETIDLTLQSDPHYSISNGSTQLLIGDSPPLPVQISYFMASKMDNSQVKIEWSTRMEANNDYFLIQKSNDGIHWKDWKKVKGAGDSNIMLSYCVIDDHPNLGMNYYRLKQVDFDGNFSYSKIEVVEINSMNPCFSLYPNPNRGTVFIQGFSSANGVNVFDVRGNDCTHLVKFSLVDSNTIVLDLNNLSPGMYLVQKRPSVNNIRGEENIFIPMYFVD